MILGRTMNRNSKQCEHEKKQKQEAISFYWEKMRISCIEKNINATLIFYLLEFFDNQLN